MQYAVEVSPTRTIQGRHCQATASIWGWLIRNWSLEKLGFIIECGFYSSAAFIHNITVAVLLLQKVEENGNYNFFDNWSDKKVRSITRIAILSAWIGDQSLHIVHTCGVPVVQMVSAALSEWKFVGLIPTFTPSAQVRRQSLPVWLPALHNLPLIYFYFYVAWSGSLPVVAIRWKP